MVLNWAAAQLGRNALSWKSICSGADSKRSRLFSPLLSRCSHASHRIWLITHIGQSAVGSPLGTQINRKVWIETQKGNSYKFTVNHTWATFAKKPWARNPTPYSCAAHHMPRSRPTSRHPYPGDTASQDTDATPVLCQVCISDLIGWWSFLLFPQIHQVWISRAAPVTPIPASPAKVSHLHMQKASRSLRGKCR